MAETNTIFEAIILQLKINKYKLKKKGSPRCKLVQSLWKTAWRFPRKLKIELSYDPAIPLLGIYLDKTLIQNDTCTSVLIVGLFAIVKMEKQPRCPSPDEWINKTWHMYTMEYYSAIKRTNNASCRNMDATRHCHTK